MTTAELAAALRAVAASQARIELQQAEVLEAFAEQREALLRIEARLASAPEAGDLVEALRSCYPGVAFTARTVLMECDGDPHGRLAAAVGAVVDMNLPQHARAVALGQVLRTLPGVLLDGDRRGSGLYKLRV